MFTANVVLKIDPCQKVMTILSPGIQPIYKDTLGRSKFRSNEKEPDASRKKILELYFSQLAMDHQFWSQSNYILSAILAE